MCIRDRYEQCLDCIWNWACEVPYFQLFDELLYNSARVDPSALPADMTAYYGWVREIQSLELKAKEEALP